MAVILLGCTNEEAKTVKWYQVPENKALQDEKLVEFCNDM